jgi:hypothetical protein
MEMGGKNALLLGTNWRPWPDLSRAGSRFERQRYRKEAESHRTEGTKLHSVDRSFPEPEEQARSGRVHLVCGVIVLSPERRQI